jgi:uncharacterized membrane protein
MGSKKARRQMIAVGRGKVFQTSLTKDKEEELRQVFENA